jgi:hypothetical protein
MTNVYMDCNLVPDVREGSGECRRLILKVVRVRCPIDVTGRARSLGDAAR